MYIFGVLDIGSEAVKLLLIQKKQDKKEILAKSIQEYERFGVFETRDFETDVMIKAIQQAVEGAQKQANLEISDLDLIIGLAAHIFKARLISKIIERKQPKIQITTKEKQEIFNNIFKKTKKEVLKQIVQELGIPVQEFDFLCFKPLQIKIDGYQVNDLIGLHGRTIELKLLASFVPKDYLNKIQKIIKQLGFEKIRIFHEAEAIIKTSGLKENILFLDIGADFTQIFLFRADNIDFISEVKLGGEFFSKALCQNFGILYNEAKNWSYKYQKGLFAPETKNRLRQILLKQAQHLYLALDKKLGDKLFFKEIHCFGGAALYPEIQEILEKNYQKPVKILKESQFQPALLLSNLFNL